MVWVGKKVGWELVVVPYKTFLEVLVDGVHIYFRKLFVHNKAVETMHKEVDARGL